mgnify:CR=1 FL=1
MTHHEISLALTCILLALAAGNERFRAWIDTRTRAQFAGFLIAVTLAITFIIKHKHA